MPQSHASREESAQVMEQIYADAFEKAKSWRKDHGITGADGKRKPPGRYKMTLWLAPWHYMQICNDASRAGVSVTKHLHEQLTDPRIKAYLPTRENKKLWKEEEKAEGKGVASLSRKRKQRQLAAKGAVSGIVLPPAKQIAFARARRQAGLRA